MKTQGCGTSEYKGVAAGAKGRARKAAGDFLYTAAAAAVMNVVLQIVVYPLTKRLYGEEVTGEIVHFIAFIYIVPQALGTALNNSRLVLRKTNVVSNADFSRALLLSSAVSALACSGIGFFESKNALFAVFFGAFSVLYLLRVYAEVDFRLSLKFKGFFLYYCIISAGYLVGFGLYLLTHIWLLIFITGEAAALLYVLFRGTIFRKSLRRCRGALVAKIVLLIALPALMRDCVMHFDKVILIKVGKEAVIQYHVVSLIAKALQMLIYPINTLILSYLTLKDASVSKKGLYGFSGAALLFGGLFYVFCIVGTPVYIRLFYPGMYGEVIGYNCIVNLGLVICFVASLFMTFILSQGKTVTNNVVECVSAAVYLAAAVFVVPRRGIWGLAYLTLAVNSAKLLAALIFTLSLKDAKPLPAGQTEQAEQTLKIGQTEQAEQTPKIGQAEQTEQTLKIGQAEQTEQTLKIGQAEQAEQAVKTEQKEQTEIAKETEIATERAIAIGAETEAKTGIQTTQNKAE